MNHLLNFLAGIGSAMNPFGTAPGYKLPSPRDRLTDNRHLRSDVRSVGRDLTKKTSAALSEQYGKINNRTTAQ